jgi:hypothetical protein
MNTFFKKIMCLFKGHQWHDNGGHYVMCWRCGELVHTPDRWHQRELPDSCKNQNSVQQRLSASPTGH